LTQGQRFALKTNGEGSMIVWFQDPESMERGLFFQFLRESCLGHDTNPS
jgi:hypothetical protein